MLRKVYRLLYERYGPQGWWPGDGQQLDVVIGAILTQAAAWTNVEKAIHALKESGCWSLEAVHQRPQEELASIIRSCGYFNAKARKLKAFAGHVACHYGGDLAALLGKPLGPLREELLSIHGIGHETADDILVYATGKPSFVIDSYTRRIVNRLGLAPEARKADYYTYQAMFQDNLPPDVSLFNEYHALLDEHAKVACTKVPTCSGCCLQGVCATGKGGEPPCPRVRGRALPS